MPDMLNKEPLKKAEGFSAPPGGLLRKVQDLYARHVPEEAQDALTKLLKLASIVGADDPSSALAAGPLVGKGITKKLVESLGDDALAQTIKRRMTEGIGSHEFLRAGTDRPGHYLSKDALKITLQDKPVPRTPHQEEWLKKH